MEKTIGEWLGLSREEDEKIFNLAVDLAQEDDPIALLKVIRDTNLSEKEKIVLSYYIGIILGAGEVILEEEREEEIEERIDEETRNLLLKFSSPQTYNN